MDIRAALDHATRQREATPGKPEDGPYPATVDEVADEVLAWLREMERTSAHGLMSAMRTKLIIDSIRGEDR